jgi:tight adherence protein B
MIALSLVCAVLAALLLAAPPAARRLGVEVRPGRGEEAAAPAPRNPRWPWRVGWGAGLTAVVLTHYWWGPAGAALALAGLIVATTCVHLVEQHLRDKAAARARAEVAQACSVLASQVRVGRVPAEALHEAAEDSTVLRVASSAQDLGGDVVAVWRTWSVVPGHGGLNDLARAWQVSARTGAPLAHSLVQVAEALTADLALRAVVSGELSAPRATGKIMAVLPFLGLSMGYSLGGDPVRFLMAGPYGWACLVLGVGLAVAGVLWIDRLARQAGDQGS